jgi:hypothetical protein
MPLCLSIWGIFPGLTPVPRHVPVLAASPKVVPAFRPVEVGNVYGCLTVLEITRRTNDRTTCLVRCSRCGKTRSKLSKLVNQGTCICRRGWNAWGIGDVVGVHRVDDVLGADENGYTKYAMSCVQCGERCERVRRWTSWLNRCRVCGVNAQQRVPS